MKTRTYKALLVILVVMQIAGAALIWVSTQQSANAEQEGLMRFSNDLLKMHLLIGDYELQAAANGRLEPTDAFEQLRTSIYANLDALEKSTKSEERREIYDQQRKLFDAALKVMYTVREGVNNRSASDQFATMVIMLAGMKKLHKIATKIHDNQQVLIDPQMLRTDSNPVLPLVAVGLCGLSAVIAVVLFLKGPKGF